jgi:hypothetical protein
MPSEQYFHIIVIALRAVNSESAAAARMDCTREAVVCTVDRVEQIQPDLRTFMHRVYQYNS